MKNKKSIENMYKIVQNHITFRYFLHETNKTIRYLISLLIVVVMFLIQRKDDAWDVFEWMLKIYNNIP